MPLRDRIRRAAAYPPRELVREVGRRITAKITEPYRRWDVHRHPSYLPATEARLAPLLRGLDAATLQELSRSTAEPLAWWAAQWMDHRFDLLGSGTQEVRRGAICAGLHGHRYPPQPAPQPDSTGRWLRRVVNNANWRESAARWQLIDDPRYQPIDWQMDFRSGYRWREDTWHEDLPYGHLLGVDVKLPWELARAQHLPQLALAHALAESAHPGFGHPERYAREFRNQIIDFVATNPPSYGINWRCTMDVAIRVANWVVAFDLFRVQDVGFDEPFLGLMAQTVAEHASFIRHHLEWSPTLRANHYLADVAGLLIAAAALPPSAERDEWLRFAAQEVLAETLLQFDEQGVNFEASTSYHRLSAEMVVWALAAGIRAGTIERRDIPADVVSRLGGMAAFTRAVTKLDGHVAQVGDNDSGRFLKLSPACSPGGLLPGGEWSPDGWHEDVLDHRHLFALIGGASGDDALVAEAGDAHRVEAAIVRALSGGALPLSDPTPVPGVHGASPAQATHGGGSVRWRLHVRGPDLTDGLQGYAFPSFGLYVMRSPRLYLSIRCGPVGQNGNGGHAHNDQLAVELQVDGEDWIRDPGTYVYTPLPDERNRYRSVRSHFAPACGDEEPSSFNHGLFTLPDRAHATCTAFDGHVFVGLHYGFGGETVRVIRVEPDGIEIEDRLPCLDGARVHDVHSPAELAALLPELPRFSPGYGLLD